MAGMPSGPGDFPEARDLTLRACDFIFGEGPSKELVVFRAEKLGNDTTGESSGRREFCGPNASLTRWTK